MARFVFLSSLIAATLIVVRLDAPPAEDAAMLMRYAQHVAAGHGIVWNVGEAPMDGATDMLPMLAAAGITRLGASPEAAVKGLALAAHLALVCLIWVAARRRFAAPPWIALLASLLVLWSPGLLYASVGFVTSVFALAAAVLWLLVLEPDPQGEARDGAGVSLGRRDVACAIAALVLGLVRPDGVLLAWIIIGAFVVVRGRGALRLARTAAIVYAIAGGAYFAWRWWYFGHPLPTPYYRKGSFQLHPDGVLFSLNFAGRFLWWAALPVWLAFRSGGAARRRALMLAIVVAAFAGAWVLLSSEMNFAGRFQYALLPIAAIWIAAAWRDWPARSTSALVAALIVAAIAGDAVQYWPAGTSDDRREIGRALAPFMTPDRTMAVSEAGLLPFYSNWRAIDALGLNDVDIARHRIDAARLERAHPDLIMVHTDYDVSGPPPPGLDDVWTKAVETLVDYARRHRYRLARDIGASPSDTHLYFVDPAAPDADAIVNAIAAVPASPQPTTAAQLGLVGTIRRLIRSL